MTRVARLPKDPGPAGWAALLPDPPPARVLDGDRTADWLVIGAGFAGLAAARRLVQLRGSDRIVLLEASRVGSGPAGRNSGFMVDLPHNLNSDDYGGSLDDDRMQIRQNRAAIAFAGEAAEEYGLPAEAYDACGKINAAATDQGLAHNAAYGRHLATLGEAHEPLDVAQMRALTGTTYYKGGLFTPGAVQLQPALYVRGVARGLAADIDLYEESPVTELVRVGPDWRARTSGGSVTAPRVILAVNGHAESFGYFGRRLMHVFTYASMTRALTEEEVKAAGGQRVWGVTPSDPMGTTVRRLSGTGGDRIVVRNRFTYDPSMEVSAARLDRVARDHDASFAARFPMLRGVVMQYRWGGRLCLSWNSVPAFGEVDDGVFFGLLPERPGYDQGHAGRPVCSGPGGPGQLPPGADPARCRTAPPPAAGAAGLDRRQRDDALEGMAGRAGAVERTKAFPCRAVQG